MPMDKLPAIIPPSAASLDATKEARVPAMLRIKGGQIIGIEDHLGNVLGQPLTVKSGGDRRIRKVTGGNGEKWLPVSGQSHFAPQMKLVLSATAPVTRHAAFVIPFGFTAFKLRMFNAHTAAVDYKYAFTTQGALGDAIYNAATWTPVTVGGSTTITIPGCTGVPPDHSLSYVDSDIIYLDPED